MHNWIVFHQQLDILHRNTKEEEQDRLLDKNVLLTNIGSLVEIQVLNTIKNLLISVYMVTINIIKVFQQSIDFYLNISYIINIKKYHLSCLLANYFYGRRYIPLLTMTSKAKEYAFVYFVEQYS